jgi:hypothetical protein
MCVVLRDSAYVEGWLVHAAKNYQTCPDDIIVCPFCGRKLADDE